MNYLSSHLRIVSAFIVREIATRYGRSPGGYIWAFVEPIAYIAMMSVISLAFARLPALGESFPLFFATGYVAYSMYGGMAGYLSSAITANKNLLQYPNVASIDPVIGRAILQSITSILVAIVVLWAARSLERHSHQMLWSVIFEAIISAWMLAGGIALTNIVLFTRFPLYEKVFYIITRPLFMLSGVFFVPSQMPHPFKEILLSNPLAQVVILFREGFYGATVADGADLSYLFWCSSVLLFFGLTIFTIWPVGRLR